MFVEEEQLCTLLHIAHVRNIVGYHSDPLERSAQNVQITWKNIVPCMDLNLCSVSTLSEYKQVQIDFDHTSGLL